MIGNANPDLPILEELGRELELMIGDGAVAPAPAPMPGAPAHEAPSHRTRPAPAGRRRGHRDRPTVRIARRALVVVVLLCLVGGVALAARFVGDDGGTPDHTAPALLGRAGGGAWHVSAYRDQGRLCLLLDVAGSGLTSECGATPGPTGARTTSLRAGGTRLVVGLSGPQVASVVIRAGAAKAAAATHAAADLEAASEAGVPTGTRWFVASLSGAGSRPALVTPRRRDGERAGASYLDCSLGVVGRACQRRISAAATAAERDR